MENNNKSQAEIYREERKARLAKEAAKKARKSPMVSKTKKLIGKIIAIVLAVAIGLGAIGGILNFFGVPQKVIKVSVTEDTTCSFSVAEYNFYYYTIWNNYSQYAQQYAAYGMDMGFDYTASPAEQEYTDDYSSMTGVTVEELGVENPTWADVFKFSAIYQLIQVKYGTAMAEKEGIVLDETEIAEIDTAIEEVRTTAKENDYSIDRFLRTQLGNGIDEKLTRQVYEEQSLSAKYFTKLQEDTEAAITDAQIEEEYNANKDSYDLVSVRFYEFAAVEPELADDATDEEIANAEAQAQADAKAQADAFLAGVKDEESFIAQAKKAILTEDSESTDDPDEITDFADVTYTDMEYYGENVVKWIYDDARQVGDKTVIDAGDGYYDVILITELPHKDASVYSNNVRHILVTFPTDETTGETKELSDTEKAEYKAKAQEILDEYLKNPTEENFAALATEKSEDAGSVSTGGLYENVMDDGTYVEAFTDWSVDPARKQGDTGIVETEFGYHVMYYSKANGVTWQETVRETVFTEKFNTMFDEIMNPRMDSIDLDSAIINWATKAENKHIAKQLAYSSASATA